MTLTNCELTAPDTVACDTMLEGPGVPPLEHPWTEISTATVVNGKIVRLEETLSDETRSDLAAFIAAQPGMPTTGSVDMSLALWALVLALLSLVAGVLTRRTYAYLR